MSTQRSLASLLSSAFTVEDLRRLVLELPDMAHLVNALPGDPTPLDGFISALLSALERHLMLGDDFFEALKRARPRRAREIDEIRTNSLNGQAPGEHPAAAHSACDLRIPNRLPLRLLHHLPREPIKRQIFEHLSGGDIRAVTLYGIDGIGKSTLLAELARQIKDDLPVRAALLFYIAPENHRLGLDQILADLATTKGLSPPRHDTEGEGADPDELLARKIDELTDAIADAHEVWILIDNLERQLHRNGAFDNFELDALFSALPSRLLERKHPPRLRLISASALKPTLPRAEGLSMLLLKLDPLSDAEALKLLLKASGHSAPDDYAPLRLLVASVHGIPAAIIALSKIARSDKSSFAALLDDHQLDTARRALADDLQDGLRRVVDIAVGRVQGDTRALLNALAIFSGPVSGRILRATAGVGSSTAFRIALEEAVACQLLHVHDGAYELPGFLREPLRRMLPAESTHALHRRAADAVILGHEADPEAWNTRDHAEPFITRVEHLLAANDREQAQAALIEYQLDGFSRLGLYASAAELRLQLAELYRDSPASRASHLRSCAILLTYLGRYDEARVRLIEATELTQGDRRALSFCLNAQGILAYNQRRLRDARDLYRSSLELALELELDDNHIAVRHTNLAEVCANIGELEEGERHAHSALDLFRCASPRTTPLPWKSRYTGNIGVAWADLAKIHLARGELRQAAYHSDLAVSLARGEMHARRIGVALIIRGQIALAERRFAAACRCWSEAQACYHAIKSPRGLGRAHFYLGLGHHHAGELAEAERNYQESINLRHAESLFAANTYLALLNLARGPNAHDHALALARHSMSDCQRQIDAGHDFHDVYYALALAKLIEALLDPSQTAESRARDAYQAAWCTCSAAGIRAQALQTLELLPEPARERPLISAIQELLNTNTTEPATARPSPL